jgi:hypothetical protein
MRHLPFNPRQIPGSHMWQTFSARCWSTSKSVIGAEYTEGFTDPHSQNSRNLRSGNRASLRVLPLFAKAWSLRCLAVRRKWDGAPSCMNMCYCCWRGTCSKSTGKSLTKWRCYTTPVSLKEGWELALRSITLNCPSTHWLPVFQQSLLSANMMMGIRFAHLGAYSTPWSLTFPNTYKFSCGGGT